MRSTSRRPVASKRQSSTLVACAEKSAKLTPSPSQVAPSGCGRPSRIRVLDSAMQPARVYRATSPASSRYRRTPGCSRPGPPPPATRVAPAVPRAAASRVEKHSLEVAVAVEPEAVQHVAREDDEPRSARPEGDRASLEIVDRPVGRVRPHHEHAGGGVHRGEDAQVRRGAADAGERLVDHLALHQGQVERAGLQPRHVLGRALGIARAHVEGRVHLVAGVSHRLPADLEAAARSGGPRQPGGAPPPPPPPPPARLGPPCPTTPRPRAPPSPRAL